MQIILSSDAHTGVSDIQNWLDFNQLDYRYQTFWNQDIGGYRLDFEIENSVVIFSANFLTDFTSTSLSHADHIDVFKKFLEQNNQLWFAGCDTAVTMIKIRMQNFIENLDFQIRPASMMLFLDAEPTDRCYLSRLQNIRICVARVNHFNRTLPRVQANTLRKLNVQYDFLLTMIRRPTRPHRNMLWNQLGQRPELLGRGLAKCHTRTNKDKLKLDWMGQQSHQHDWQDGHASMDLYLQCWLEIVPETCYRDLYFFTEKTQKPIMTQTPFLVVTTAGYLAWLRSQGFRTFDSLINEGYDLHHRIQDRIRCMLDVLEDIIHNDIEAFYQASKPILQHNFYRLCEISGSWQHEFDSMMWQSLEDATESRVRTMLERPGMSASRPALSPW